VCIKRKEKICQGKEVVKRSKEDFFSRSQGGFSGSQRIFIRVPRKKMFSSGGQGRVCIEGD
jgi:hypothetical protein